MDISICTEEDIPRLKELWRECFDDTEEYIEYYFSSVAKRNIIFAARDNGRIVSMVHLNPYDVFIRNNDENKNLATAGNIQNIYTENIYNLHYIVGVATAVSHRKKGLMRQVLNEAMEFLKRNGEPATYLMPANPAYYTGLGFEILENSYMVSTAHISDIYSFKAHYKSDKDENRTEDRKCIPDGIYSMSDDVTEKNKIFFVDDDSYINKKIFISEENFGNMLYDFNNRLSHLYDMFVIRDMSYINELDRQCRTLEGHAYILCYKGRIEACFGIMVEAGAAEIIQYTATENYMEYLAYIMKHLQYNWNETFELFGNIKNLLSDEVKVDKGHGIMYNILSKNFSKSVNCDKMLMINEIV